VSLTAIIDYGMCNLDSVARAIEECGGTARVTHDESDVRAASHVVLPGVGSYADAMRNIRDRSLDQILAEHVFEREVPFLGICLGMQLLSSLGSEGGRTNGLGVIPGEVVKFEPTDADRRIPHVGWNEVEVDRESPLFEGMTSGRDFYFVHSYHFRCANSAHILARTPYAGGFVSAISSGVTFAVQFHPEKSQRAGFQLLRNFLKM
jgi:imidazole glycerol-phosphate synthase subunit HisH